MAKVEELIKKEIEQAKEKLIDLKQKEKELKVYIKAREKFCKMIGKTETGDDKNEQQ